MFDPKQMHVVKQQIRRKTSEFQIKFNEETERFKLSDKFINDNNLSTNGLTFGKYPDGSFILAVVPEEQAQFYTKKGNYAGKGSSFKHAVMAQMFKDAGMQTGTLKAEKVHEDETGVYYSISAGTPKAKKPASTQEEEVVDQDLPSQDQEAPIAEVDFEDPALGAHVDEDDDAVL